MTHNYYWCSLIPLVDLIIKTHEKTELGENTVSMRDISDDDVQELTAELIHLDRGSELDFLLQSDRDQYEDVAWCLKNALKKQDHESKIDLADRLMDLAVKNYYQKIELLISQRIFDLEEEARIDAGFKWAHHKDNGEPYLAK